MSLDFIVPVTEIMSGDLLEDLMSSEGMFAYRRAGIFVFFRYSQKDSKVEPERVWAHLSLENQLSSTVEMTLQLSAFCLELNVELLEKKEIAVKDFWKK